MKKQSSKPHKNNKQINELVSANKVTPKDKVFNPTTPSHDFPEGCVTMDTFFSDLEDYIQLHHQLGY